MLKGLKIKNFKAIEEIPEIIVRPLTLLVGPNCGGKSSILQPLVLLRQTVESIDITSPLAVHKPLDFGSYRDFIFGHEDKRHLRIELKYETRLPLRTLKPAGSKVTKVKRERHDVRVLVEFGYNRKLMEVFLVKTEFLVPSLNARFNISRTVRGDYEASVSQNGLILDLETLGPYKFYGLTATKVKKEAEQAGKTARQLITLAFHLSSSLEDLFEALFYIGPLREWPKRIYPATGEKPKDVGLRGERSVDVLWVASRTKHRKAKLFPKVNNWLKEFNVSLQVSLKRIGGNNYSVNLEDPITNMPVNLADVGFGASQLLPVIVEGFYAPKGAVILIEHPDIHLHPRAQATLADLFTEIAKEGKTLIIETHSEHLISRIQRRIAEGRLGRDEVSIYYCEPGRQGSKITEICLDSMGRFESEGLPEKFFEEDYIETVEHYKAMLEKVRTG